MANEAQSEGTICVLTGEVKASKEKVKFNVPAIGSCVVVAAYDVKTGVSAVAHIMLPGVSPPKSYTPHTRYAFNAIEELMTKMDELGSNTENVEVCVVGGSNVLKRKDDTICQSNINSVFHILQAKNIKIKATSVGGTERRSIFFDTKNGQVYHSTGNEDDKLLYCFISDD